MSLWDYLSNQNKKVTEAATQFMASLQQQLEAVPEITKKD